MAVQFWRRVRQLTFAALLVGLGAAALAMLQAAATQEPPPPLARIIPSRPAPPMGYVLCENGERVIYYTSSSGERFAPIRTGESCSCPSVSPC